MRGRLALLLAFAVVVSVACAASTPSIPGPDPSGILNQPLGGQPATDAAVGGPDPNPVLSIADPSTYQPTQSVVVTATSHTSSDAKGFCPSGEDIDIHVTFMALNSSGQPYQNSAFELVWGWYWEYPGTAERGTEHVTGTTKGIFYPKQGFNETVWPVSQPCAQKRAYRLEVRTQDPGKDYSASWNLLVTTDPRYPAPIKGYQVTMAKGTEPLKLDNGAMFQFNYDCLITPAA